MKGEGVGKNFAGFASALKCLEVLLVNRLAVRGSYENEYFGAIRLLQATIYLLFGVIHVDNFQLYKWFEKLMLGCLDY